MSNKNLITDISLRKEKRKQHERVRLRKQTRNQP